MVVDVSSENRTQVRALQAESIYSVAMFSEIIVVYSKKLIKVLSTMHSVCEMQDTFITTLILRK
jgi:hypothetical protein